jgi:hypothetical protein
LKLEKWLMQGLYGVLEGANGVFACQRLYRNLQRWHSVVRGAIDQVFVGALPKTPSSRPKVDQWAI